MRQLVRQLTEQLVTVHIHTPIIQIFLFLADKRRRTKPKARNKKTVTVYGICFVLGVLSVVLLLMLLGLRLSANSDNNNNKLTSDGNSEESMFRKLTKNKRYVGTSFKGSVKMDRDLRDP